ncbi:hypothetical protein [Streptomyces sp. H27-H5]|uniref:hypothetical protein n=1 Tax=Streptomyces sp. H27-H5 TaxID=2996460 RepID=UPI00226FA118|nr:hypothetical protein [Streptomyces sp. H27-H5]MCY0961464.1 hypothetical protein [Streptomyces sp. H27-H5]
MTNTPTLAALRAAAEKSAKKAEEDRGALIAAAVAEAVTSTKYGHLSAVAREAGIVSQYLRELVEEAHPGWLARAAEEREAEKASRPKGRRRAAA